MATAYSAISFATVAPRYNSINALPELAAEQVAACLARLIPSGGPILDMGCGAGRIAVPAATIGLRVFGIDLDLGMLAESGREADEGALPLWLCRADVTRMPFADASFDAVLSINVLHLVPDWEQALDEAVRVLLPAGLLIQGRDWLDPDSCAGRLRSRLREEVMALNPELQPSAAAAPPVMARALAERGGAHDPDQIAASWTTPISPAEVLDQMEARTHNETWMLDDELLATAVGRLRAWAAATWADLHVVEPVARRFILTVTRGLK